MPYARLAALVLPYLLLSACGGGGSDSSTTTPTPPASSCSLTSLETQLRAALDTAPSEVDFAYAVQRNDGRRFDYQRGSVSMNSSLESASTSKLVTAVVILRLVEQGYLKLSDRPQDWIADWPISQGDPLYSMTLAQLLSFTSGLTQEPLCQNLPGTDFAACVRQIATGNIGNGATPGTAFHYASTHLQVAGLMAMRARGLSSWQAVFNEFRSQTGQFANARYDLPSETNPRLAGGMHWTGNEYLAFLKALQAGQLLNPTSMQSFLQDRTAGLAVTNSPAKDALNEDWHYGTGYWHECQSSSYNCTAGTRLSSPGAYGAYPYWQREKGYVGMLARQGALGTFRNGAAIERAVRPQVEAWVACQ